MAEANKRKDPLINSSTRVSGSYDFWDVLETHMGVKIAPYVKNVLSLSNLDNPLSFRHITEETINELETFSRDTVKIILKPEDDKEEFYGLYGRSPGKFKFMIGDRHLISELVNFVKSKSQEFWKSANIVPNVASKLKLTVAPRVTPKVPLQVTPKVPLQVTPKVPPRVTPRVTPPVAQRFSPRLAQRVTPRIARRVTPRSAQRDTPTAARRVTPRSVQTVTPRAAQRVTPKIAQRVTAREVPRITPKVEPNVEEDKSGSKVSKRGRPTKNYRPTTFTISTSRNFEAERKTISNILKKIILQEKAKSNLEKWKMVSAEDVDMIFTGATVNEGNGSERSHLYEIKVKCVFCGKYIIANCQRSKPNGTQLWCLANYKVHLLKH